MGDIYLVHKDHANELYHYGVKGMKWGHRKNVYDINANYYNKRADKLTAKANRNKMMADMNKRAAASGGGKGLISKANTFNANYYDKKASKLQSKANRNRTMASMNEAASKHRQERVNSEEYKAKRAKALKVGATAASVALSYYAGKKVYEVQKNRDLKRCYDRGVEVGRSMFATFEPATFAFETFRPD